MFHVPNQYRITPIVAHMQQLQPGNNGVFVIPSPTGTGRKLTVIASDGMGWEHVSVHAEKKNSPMLIPYWDEMNYVKCLFWDDDDIVIQYHPRKEEYVNYANCLHLWRPIGVELPTPPKALV